MATATTPKESIRYSPQGISPTSQPTEFFKTTVTLPRELAGFIATRAGQPIYAGNASGYFRDLVLSDQQRRTRIPKTEPATDTFRTSISLPSELEEFVLERSGEKQFGGSASAYFRGLVRADQARFIKLPAKERSGWRSPKAVRR